ncbi:MAG: hypothetical protein WC367_00260 [Methanoregula sp.]|jgi:hypothetical protein
MPRVGSYTYPLFRLNALLKDTKTLHEKFGTKEFTRDHVAQVLGQKSTSGGLSQKLADLKSYGLISNTQGRFTVLDIGIKATFGTESEKTDALDKAVRNIPLWRAIYEKCGKDPLADTFNLDLAEITGITRPESQNIAETVRKSYMDDAKHLVTVDNHIKNPDSEKPQSDDGPYPARSGTAGVDPQPPAGRAISVGAIGGMSGNEPVLYVPELGASFVIDTPRKFQVAKIFWEAIAAKWEGKSQNENGEPQKEKSSEQNHPPIKE